ncbi:hypothetical protein CKO28_24965 [Rhodovibrio sodomensis]|uniref:DUF3450 domain-containing protein n=2 Tax=Rhodovibrio sodomensis TaxID=1088 RepID=A0ABS1DML9_9PROT|nr:hypothetical protein [Rhodovibrio sodomensis]
MSDDQSMPDGTPDPTEEDLWHALSELMRRIPGRAQRTMALAAGVRAALYERMGQAKSPETDLTSEEPPISEEAERTLATFREDPPFSLPRLQARTAQQRLERELDKWPTERRAELIREMRDKLERRRVVLGEIQPADARQGQQWLQEAIDDALQSGDSTRSINDLLREHKKRQAFRELIQEIVEQPDEEQINAMRGALRQMRRDRRNLEAISRIVDEDRHQATLDAIESADRGECASQAEIEIADAERRSQADTSDRPRWGQITQVFGFQSPDGRRATSVWDGAICWPVDTARSVDVELGLGAIVWFRPAGEWAVIQHVESPGEDE